MDHNIGNMSSLTVRPFDPESDFSKLATLATAIEAVDQAGNDTNEDSLRLATWKTRWVIENPADPGQLVGHGWIGSQSPTRLYLYVAVHPAWRRTGLGHLLLEYGLGSGRPSEVEEVIVPITAANKVGSAFLQKHGFHPAGHNRILTTRQGVTFAEPLWPRDYMVRNYVEIDDPYILVEAHNRCYSDHWGHYENSQELTVEKLAELMNAYPLAFIPEGIFLLFAPDGDLAGLSYGRISESADQHGNRTRIVDSPGVVPFYRYLPLYRSLALLTVQWLKSQGAGPLELHCFGEDEETVEVYRSIGFDLSEVNDSVDWVKKLNH